MGAAVRVIFAFCGLFGFSPESARAAVLFAASVSAAAAASVKDTDE